MTWHADIALGADYAWSIDQADPDDPDVDDSLAIVSLDFGWSMPSGGLWPVQPDVSMVTAVLNVPFFGDIGAVPPDITVLVEIKADATGDVVARFYGDLDTLRAEPRAGRPGITLTIIGVDYTARVNELPTVPNDGAGGSAPTYTALNYLWALYMPGGTGLSDPGLDGLIYTNDAGVDVYLPAGDSELAALVNQLLIQVCNHDDQTRMMWSPLVDADGQLAPRTVGGFFYPRLFTLDTIKRGTATAGDGYDPVTLPADAIDRGIGWSAARANNPGGIRITGWGNDASNYIIKHIGTGDTTTYTYLAVTLDAVGIPGDGLGEIADFYGLPWNRWQADTVTVLASDAGVGALVPVGIFPDWTLPEGDDGRSMCYGRAVTITDVDVTETPDGTSTFTGVLTGARCYIQGGHLYFDLALRTLVPAAPSGDGGLRLGAYGEAPAGGLATT